ncbi:MAG: FAD-dependent oxidoreductase [Acidobacteria bacterium]|nr:FAD-dependent oxidoreductase [Acidobacteriota bacterium]
MSESKNSGHLVVTIGAGPAGIYSARKLADAGHKVIILNRDIKPGGLVEYGIYFNKHKLKEGVRKQFRNILSDPNVQYFGHVKVGENADLTIEEVKKIFQPSAIIIAAGAQGTKALGIPGDTAPGVYHAKDVVYYYNGLPPFSEGDFQFGRRVAIIGIGNVMVDIAHFLVHVKKVDEVIAVARRGPTQRAYTDVEIQSVAANIDTTALRAELERIRPNLESVGDDIETIYGELTKHVNTKAKEGESPTRLLFRFLSSPTEVVLNDTGRPAALRVENTELVQKGESLSARGLGTHDDIPVDTVIFAIGDRVDETLGLPASGNEYVKNPNPDPNHPGDEAYQVYDPQSEQVMAGTFVIGWSRKASDGLVGKAKQDGEKGIVVVNHYLDTVAPGSAENAEEKVAAFLDTINKRRVRHVTWDDIKKLEEAERKIAQERGFEFFKYETDADMLKVIESE